MVRLAVADELDQARLVPPVFMVQRLEKLIDLGREPMPDDVEPLRKAAAAASRSEVHVLLITSGIQFVHFWNVVSDLGIENQVREGLSRTMIASIGPSASAELRRHGFEPSFEPSHPKMGLLVREAAERVSR